MKKRICILGSTGSIGRNALRVIEGLQDGYTVECLTAHNNVELLSAQARKFGAKRIAITNPQRYAELKKLCTGLDVEILSGAESMSELASSDYVDTVLTAVVGAAGLKAVLAAAKAGKRLAIANKEPLVIAGELLMEEVKKSGAEVLPVDSEHSAIFQALNAGNHDEIEKILLTSSGGPFRGYTASQMATVTLADALSHPTWSMGPKITVDSATMMNKALEVIEARWLFDVPVEKIEILVHPESIIHSMVEFVDGSVVAQLGEPDMCLPIQYAFTYPRRVRGICDRLRLDELSELHFSRPDFAVFRSLELGYEVAKRGGSDPVVFNAANEEAVSHFLEQRIGFGRIIELVEQSLAAHDHRGNLTLAELFEVDRWARDYVRNELVNSKLTK
jgi:1-deoxy-D-xylulose-5-phosphate reductoisomerase